MENGNDMEKDANLWSVAYKELGLTFVGAHKPVLLKFYRDNCAPCRILAPMVKSLANEFDFDLVDVDTRSEQHRELYRAFDIRSIPRMVLFSKAGDDDSGYRTVLWDSNSVGSAPAPVKISALKHVLSRANGHEPVYDSAEDTFLHIDSVWQRIKCFCMMLGQRGLAHDMSKLEEPEKSVFDRETPKLRELEYGSDAYKESLVRLGDALKHHYQCNSHHPEHFENGVSGMNLLDLVEMYLDWSAAVSRTKNGDLRKSIGINAERFGLCDQLRQVLENTVTALPGFDEGVNETADA